MKTIFRLMIFIMPLFLLITPVHSQSTYTLEPATVDEFIEAIPDILRGFGIRAQQIGEPDHLEEVTRILEYEFWLRYADEASIEQVSDVYDLLNDGWSAFAFYAPYLKLEQWHYYTLERYLTENPTDLSSIELLEFADYQVTVQELYVTNADNPDWLLSLNYNSEFTHHWLARANNSFPTGYVLLSLPTPYTEWEYSWSQREGGSPKHPTIEDITGDGLVEFIFRDSMPAPASWTGATYYDYEVISWGGDETGLETILYTRILDNDRTPWTHENIDDDDALEVIQTVNYWDNLGCHRLSITVFDYVHSTYVEGQEISTFAESINCNLRQGEEAFRFHNFEQSIPYYERARDRYNAIINETERDTAEPYFMLASERLIIAYALSGRLDEAEALIIELNLIPQPEGTLAYAFNQILDDGITPLEVCETAYDTMQSFQAADWTANYRDIQHVGSINEAHYGEHRPNGNHDDGCDMDFFIDNIVLNSDFSSPITDLQESGFTVRTSFSADMNGDGLDDWLIWLDKAWYPFLFLSHENMYTVVETQLPELTDDLLFRAVEIPSGEFAFAFFNDYRETDCVDGGELGNRDSTGMYEVSLRIFDGENEFVRGTVGLMCSDDGSIDNLYLDETITVWDVSPYDTDRAVNAYEVSWNPDTLFYEIPVNDEMPPSIPLWEIQNKIYYLNDYEAAITQINEWIDFSERQERANLLYFRGLAYQMLGQNEEAVADYVSVYEDYPNTVWAYLAELQLSEPDANSQ